MSSARVSWRTPGLWVLILSVAGLGGRAFGQGPTLLEGVWTVTSLSASGRTYDGDDVNIVLRFSGSSYEQSVHGHVTEHGTFTLDEATHPMAIDLVVLDGAVPQMQRGVVDVSGDTLRLHVNQFGVGPRPPDFDELPGHVLIVAHRQDR